MESSFTFLRIRGIAIGANWSWLIVFALIIWSLAAALFPTTYPGLDSGTYMVMAVITAALFFTSILLHELGHAFRALKEGMTIEGITLWLFGGVARFSGMFPSAGAEFRIAIAGPLVSVALAAGFGGLALAGAALGFPDTVRGVVDYLARINAILVAFNMVPALPLDGGRVLRAWLWKRQESFLAATVSAARAGRAFGFVLIGVGIMGAFGGAGIGGLWFVFLGWFLLQAARSEATMAQLQGAFSGLRVRDVMTPDPVTVQAGMRLEDFVDQVGWTRHSTYPVVHDGLRLVGLVSLRQAASVPRERRYGASVGDVMLADPPLVTPDQPLLDALQALRSGLGRAVVLQGDSIAGILSMSDVGRALELAEVRGQPDQPPARSAGLLPWVVVATMMALAASLLYHPPLAVIAPGEAIDISRDVTITGVDVEPVNGRYLLTSVRLSQPSALFAAVAAIRTDQEVISMERVIPRDVDPDRFVEDQRGLFRESRMLAAAAAARAVGLPVEVTGTGAQVLAVMSGTPASDALREGDVIVEIDGRPINHVEDLRQVVRARPSGTTFEVRVERDGRGVQEQVHSTTLPAGAEGAVGLGVYVETRDLDVDLPFEVRFREREVGGPSAGLAYALAIADMLETQDIARGRAIAATGTIDLDGRVGPVGGVMQKAAGAVTRGSDLLIVPENEIGHAAGMEIEVLGVSTLVEALRALGARV